MKKTLLFYALLLQATFLLGQGSLQLFNPEGVEFANGQQHHVFVDLAEYETISPELFIKNISNRDISVKIRVEQVSLPDATSSFFCGLGSCFAPGTMETPNSLLLSAGQLIGPAGVFTAHYSPGEVVGNAIMRYTYFDVDNLNDTISVTYTFVGTPSSEPVQLFDHHNIEVLNGDVVDLSITDLSTEFVSPEYFVKNNTDQVMSLRCSRDVVNEVVGSENYFCVFGACLSPNIGETARDYVLSAGGIADTENVFTSHYTAFGNAGNTTLRYTFTNSNNVNDSISFSVAYTDVTGIDDYMNNSPIDIYPNPASDFVKVNLQELNLNSGRVEIYNALGTLCFDQKFTGESEVTLDLSQLPKGVYLYRVESQGSYTTTSKLILK